MAERHLCKVDVRGSIPLVSTPCALDEGANQIQPMVIAKKQFG